MALPGNLHLFAHSHPHIPHPRVILEPGVLRVDAMGLSIFVDEDSWGGVPAEVP